MLFQQIAMPILFSKQGDAAIGRRRIQIGKIKVAPFFIPDIHKKLLHNILCILRVLQHPFTAPPQRRTELVVLRPDLLLPEG